MAREINPPKFRNSVMQDYYNYLKSYSHVDQCGVDDYGRVYFHYLNGNTDRYTRRQFSKYAREWKREIGYEKGLYYLGELKASSFENAIKELYNLKEIPSGFCVNTDYEAEGYSVVDEKGIQHIYELSPTQFYDNLMKLE